jgi:hypothetical protein
MVQNSTWRGKNNASVYLSSLLKREVTRLVIKSLWTIDLNIKLDRAVSSV